MLECLKRQATSCAVIDDAEQEMQRAFLVGFAGAIHTPHTIGLTGLVGAPLEFPSTLQNIGAMSLEQRGDKALADGPAIAHVAAIENVG